MSDVKNNKTKYVEVYFTLKIYHSIVETILRKIFRYIIVYEFYPDSHDNPFETIPRMIFLSISASIVSSDVGNSR